MKSTRMLSEKNKINLIPPGPYCYVLDYSDPNRLKRENGDDNYSGIPIVSCPHLTTKQINGVNIPWCNYIEKGGISNNTTDEEFKKLVEYFGSDDNVWDYLSLDLLWDSVKECGHGGDYDYTEKDVLNWIKKIK